MTRLLVASALTLLFISGCSDETQGLDGSVGPADAAPAADAATGADATGAPDADVSGRVSISETSLDFGRVRVGTQASRTLTISNGTAQAARVTLSAPSGRDAERFVRVISVPDTDGVFEVAAGAQATVEVTVSPTAVGALVAALAGDLCGGGCPAAVTLVAEAVSTAVVCDEVLDFGLVNVGNCVRQDARCTNQGSAPEPHPGIMLDPSSDAEFTVRALTIGDMLEPGAASVTDIEYCAVAGPSTGALIATSSGAVQRTRLVGRGGGGDIVCTPESLDFGGLAVGGEAQRELVCTNRGVDPLQISSIGFDSSDFVAEPTAVQLAPGASQVFRVAVFGGAIGPITGTLTMHSDDPETSVLAVPLTAEVLDLAPCSAVIAPAQLDFGAVAPGDRRRASVSLANVGSNDCLVGRAMVSGDAAFTAGTPSATRVPPGGAATIEVTYTAPVMPGASTAVLDVVLANPQTAALRVALSGTSRDVGLVFEPESLDFGAVPSGCAAPFSRTVRVRSISATPIALGDIELGATSSAAFALSGVPASRTLAPFASFTLTVTFTPPGPGSFAAPLTVEVTGSPAPAVVPVAGRTGASAARSDEVVMGSRALDLLFVSDDSASMAAAQAALAGTAPAIAMALNARGVDFHIGVVTTDMVDAARSGRLVGPVLDTTQLGLADALAMQLAPGTAGDGSGEQGITAARAAVTPPLVTTDNAGFLRADAHLAIVILSDEDDQGALPLARTLGELRAASGSGRAQVAVMVGPANAASCTGAVGPGARAPRYHAFTALSDDGLALSFCDSMADNVARVLEAVIGAPVVPLSAAPLASTLVVSVDGALVPAVDATGTVQWVYDRAANAVRFRVPPMAGATVRVDYQPFCLSATCGDGTPDANEQCDDGNPDDTDACVEGCVGARCGDGFVQAGAEDCDDGNLVETDACLTGCERARCGDGFVQAGVEDCDDGNTSDGDACPASCDLRLSFAEWYTASALTARNYVALANETALTFADPDDGTAVLTLAHPFTLFGTTTTTLTVSPNGFVSTTPVPAGSGVANVSLPSADPPGGMLAVWWEDLLIDPAVTGGASVSFQVQGTAPNRVTVVQWRNVRLAGSQTTNNHRRFNVQLALFEGTGVIEYRYGETATSGNPATATSATVGIEDATGTVGDDLLTCSPACAGPARPQNANGFPRQSVLILTPVP